MTLRVVVIAVIGSLGAAIVAHAQTAPARPEKPSTAQYVDPVGGLALDAAITRALEHEPSMRAARSDVDVARGMRLQAGLRPNPMVSFAQQQEPAGTDSQTRIELRWPLDLFRKVGRVGVAEGEVEAARLATADRERVLAAEVRMAYGDVAAAARELSVTCDLVGAVSRQLELVSARVEQGATPPLERDMLSVELQRLESEQILQAGRAERAMIAMKRLLGLEPDVPLRIRHTLEELVQRDAVMPVSRDAAAAASRPDVQEAAARVQIADAEIDRARRDGRFDVTLFAMYMRMDAGFPQRGFTPAGDLARIRGVFHYLAGGAMVTVPIRDRHQGEVAAAQARRTGEAARLEAARLTARSEIAEARARDEYARRAAGVYSSEARALARRNLEVVAQTYELGRATVFDVVTAERRYLDVERGYTDALREAYEARQALRRALGEVR